MCLLLVYDPQVCKLWSIASESSILVDGITQCATHTSYPSEYCIHLHPEPAFYLHLLSSLRRVEIVLGHPDGMNITRRAYYITKETTAQQLLHHILSETSMSSSVSQLNLSLCLSTMDGFLLDPQSKVWSIPTLRLGPYSETSTVCLCLRSDELHPSSQLTMVPVDSPATMLLKFASHLLDTRPEETQLSAGGSVVSMDTTVSLQELKQQCDEQHAPPGCEYGSVLHPMVVRVSRLREDGEDGWTVVNGNMDVEVEDDMGRHVTVSLPPTATLHEIISAAENSLGTTGSGKTLCLVVGDHLKELPSDESTTLEQLVQPDGSVRLQFTISIITVQLGDDEKSRRTLQVAKTVKLSALVDLLVETLSKDSDSSSCALEINGVEKVADEDDDPSLAELLSKHGKDSLFVLQVY